MPEVGQTSYDEVPYDGVALVETQPDRMAAIARLVGLDPPDVATANVLELGCANGANLIPLALALPDARFVGIDLSSRQIEEGRASALAMGVRNLDLRVMSIDEVGPSLGRFDYIICHGVYSWISERLQTRTLEVCAQNLQPTGIAFVSYNTWPGWHLPGVIREMMSYHVRAEQDPEKRVRRAREFLDALVATLPDRDSVYARALTEEAAQIRPQSDSYLLHEHLEEDNRPVYFHEFHAQAVAQGLRYVGDARFWTMATCQQPQFATGLDRFSNDPIEREQYFDFLRNRRFRRTLLCHRNLTPASSPNPEAIMDLRISTLVWPTRVPIDFTAGAAADFQAPDASARVSTIDPCFKAALVILVETWPRSLPFDTLWALVAARLGPVPEVAPADPTAARGRLASSLLQAYASNVIDLHTFEPTFVTELSERPMATPWSRELAEKGRRVVNLRHRLIDLSGFERLVVRHLNGARDRDALLGELQRDVAAGRFPIHQNEREVTDPGEVRTILSRSLEPCLRRLASSALLTG